ncbi:MAG: nuclease [Bacteroidetes bacterium GWA2_30_7]|nr:MAG: nuclease [Bacteroidetes bacterium GWA2_30_7]
MYRLIDDFLIKWKSEKRLKPLVVRGARQVGKTFSITNFAKNNFTNYIKIDFEREPSLKNIFEADLIPQRICNEIELIKNVKIIKGETLIFFDEIQECSKALMSLRYFYEEMPDLHIIATGSLFEFALSEISFPVGRVQFYEMQPLCFPEYLLAIGKQQLYNQILNEPHKLSDTVHNKLLNELKYYFFIGGMPESVKTYTETSSIKNCSEVQSEIINSLRLDFAKYSPHVDKNCLNSALTNIARNVGRQTKYSSLADGYSNPTLKKAYITLQMAKLIHQISAINPIGFPVQIVSSKIFKTSLLDIGLMNYLFGIKANEEFLKTDLLAIYNGALAEQYVAQEFAVTQNNNIYYWDRQAKSSTAEVDYVIQKNQKWFPVEVKSGSSGSLRSLHLYLKEYPKTTEGIVLSSQSFSELNEQKLKFIPLYFAHSVSKMEIG